MNEEIPISDLDLDVKFHKRGDALEPVETLEELRHTFEWAAKEQPNGDAADALWDAAKWVEAAMIRQELDDTK